MKNDTLLTTVLYVVATFFSLPSMKKQRIFLMLFIVFMISPPSVKGQTLAEKLSKFSNFTGAIDNPSYNAAIDAKNNCPNGSGDKPAPKALKAFLIEQLGESPNDKADYGMTTGCQFGFHPLGMALDWQSGSPNLNVSIGNQVVDWMTKNNGEIARRMGIVQIIWTPKFPNRGGGGSADGSYGFWSSYRNKWEQYNGKKKNGSFDDSHSWHIHFSFGGNADLSTSFWQQYKKLPPTACVEPADPSPGQQDNWRWCSKCQVIFHGGLLGKCPAGGNHLIGTRNYRPFHGGTFVGQTDWRWCHNCSVLFYNGFPTKGSCSAGGQHDGCGSWNYHLNFGAAAAGQQAAFKWCGKCYGLNYGDIKGACSAGGTHDNAVSHDYKIPFKD